MSAKKPVDDRRARYLIAGAVLVLLIVVGGTFLLIGVIRGDDTDDGNQAPTSDIVTWGLAAPADASSSGR
ncbi:MULTISPECIES: hypothetical protein [unclassified Nocardioides]|uniref:hypothetical protein n=1 Tax=unclassified Nocardioides TaxID=2615069 RepID=UPI0026651F32|nr:hypothetical protein [Nocardioides sp. Arc9.136]WKN49700.1 hypothetical protein OSR43_06110 [Nocardioides sp. Arc9.136]